MEGLMSFWVLQNVTFYDLVKQEGINKPYPLLY